MELYKTYFYVKQYLLYIIAPPGSCYHKRESIHIKLLDLLRDLIMRVRRRLYARATSVTLKWPKMKTTNMAIKMLLLDSGLDRSLNGEYH